MNPSAPPHLRLAGIPVTVDPWFLLTLFLFYSLSGGGRRGVFAAVSVGAFVVVHEMGHALVARRFGAVVSIRLGFLAGWASYAAPRPLARWQRNVISLAGPFVQFVVAAGALGGLAMWSHSIRTREDLLLYFDLYQAVAWAGIILAGLNLLPLWPLDGGHVVMSFIDRRFGAAGRRAFLVWTLAACGVMVVLSATNASGPGRQMADWAAGQRVEAALAAGWLGGVWRLLSTVPAVAASSTIFIAVFCGFGAFTAMQAERMSSAGAAPSPTELRGMRREETLRQVRLAERHAWGAPTVAEFPRGFGPSPWIEAWRARAAGASPDAVSAILAHLAEPDPRWEIDDPARPEVGELLAYVPPGAAASPAVVDVRRYHGDVRDLVDAALAAYHGHPGAEGFYAVAEGMARRGLDDQAMTWLASAVERAPDPRRVATSVFLRPLHKRSDFQQLLGVAERAAAPPGPGGHPGR